MEWCNTKKVPSIQTFVMIGLKYNKFYTMILFVVSLLAFGKGKDTALHYDIVTVFAGTNTLLIFVYILLGISPASNCSWPTFRNPVSVPSSKALPLKMELTQGSETSANYNLTPGKYPKEYIQYSNYGESLKSRTLLITTTYMQGKLLFQ